MNPQIIPSPSGVRHRLMEATADLHRQLEDAVPLARSDLTLATYRLLLPRFGALVQGHEQALGPHAEQLRGVGVEPSAHHRWPLLATDLAALKLAALPPVAVSYCDTWPSALGCLYVLAGSTLGGAIIGRNLRATLGLDSAHGAAYFGGDRHAARAFRALCDILERELADARRMAQAVRGARATFATYHAVVSA